MIPVVWWNLNPEAIARGYWDQGLLEALFSGELWRVPGGYDFQHVGVDLDGDLGGAVVVVPARHNVEHVRELNDYLATLPWVLLILTGDEEGAFPVERIEHPNLRVWLMTPQAGREYGDEVRFLGSGWPPGIRAAAREFGYPEHRPRPWAFAGQVTHSRRKACVEMLKGWKHSSGEDGALLETGGFTQGVPQDQYWRTLSRAKLAPAPSGPVSPDSFRTYEALELGCVPIADNRSPDGPQAPFWQRVHPSAPFPTVEGEWDTMAAVIDVEVSAWPHNANLVFGWWQREKRKLASRLWGDIWTLQANSTGTPASWAGEPDVAVTAIVTSSPSPHHPSIEHLRTTIESVRAQLPGAEIVVVFDGVAPDLEHRRDAYEEYVRRALWACNFEWTNVVPLVLDEWRHQAAATRLALEEVRSPYLLFMEHDTPLTGEIDWKGIVATLDAREVDMIRLHHETAIGPYHAHMMLDSEPRSDLGSVPLVRTSQWSQRPHVASVGWYRNVLSHNIGADARTMIEDVMHGIVSSAWAEYGLAGWSRFRLAMYAPPGNIQRSLHLDSRRLVLGEEDTADPKPAPRFAYDGEAPAGAPQPTPAPKRQR